MEEKTIKERLAKIEECIKNMDKNIERILNNNISQRELTNKNSQNIAGMKGASGVIAGVVSIIMASIIALFFKGIHQ